MTITLDGYRVGRTQSLEDLETDLSSSLGATAEQTWIENPTSSIFRFDELNVALSEREVPISGIRTRGARKFQPEPVLKDMLSQEDANKRVAEFGVKLDIGDAGIPERALDIMISRKREEVKRQAVIDSVPSGFWNGAAEIGVGLAVSLADPINVASAFVPIVGQARYASMLAKTSSVGGRIGVRAGVGAIEGAAGAALVEPIVYLAAKAEQADYGLYDSFMNLTFGAVLGSGMHAGLGAVSDVLAKSSAATKDSLIKSAMGQAMDDKPIDIGFVARSDPSFQKEWKSNQVARAIEGAQVDGRFKAELGTVFAELEPSMRARADSLEGDARISAHKSLDEKLIPDEFNAQASRMLSERVDSFDAPPMKINQPSPEANHEYAKSAQSTIDNKLDETPETLDSLTNDIMTAIDDSGVDSSLIRAEIDGINKSVEQESAGMREALLCMIGK
jgi:hypothetical protein